jgi:hypothetical protein
MLLCGAGCQNLRADGIGAPASATSQTPCPRTMIAFSSPTLKHKCRKMLWLRVHARKLSDIGLTMCATLPWRCRRTCSSSSGSVSFLGAPRTPQSSCPRPLAPGRKCSRAPRPKRTAASGNGSRSYRVRERCGSRSPQHKRSARIALHFSAGVRPPGCGTRSWLRSVDLGRPRRHGGGFRPILAFGFRR